MKKRFLFSFLFVLLLLWLVPQAMAVGTVAGTSISNQAYVDYKDANNNPLTRVYSNTVTTVVTQIYGVSLVPAAQTQTAGTGSEASFLIQLFNIGNGKDPQTYTYTVSGDFTPSYVRIYYDINNDHALDGGDPLINETVNPSGTSATFTTATDGTFATPVNINPDDDYDVFMVVGTGTSTDSAADGENVVLTVKNKSVGDPLTPEGTGTYTTTISTAVVTSTKIHSPDAPKPGDDVTYTITLTNSGTADATDVELTDVIPGKMTYVPGSITVEGISKSDTGADANFDSEVAGAVWVDVGTIAGAALPPYASVTITFQATVNADVAAGTAITNQASIGYNVGATPITTASNGRTLFVASSPSVSVTPVATSATGDPGTKITYPVTITNNGNAADVIDVTYTSTAGWTWALWYDANNDGIAGNDGDYLLTDTDVDGVVDTGSIAQSGTVKILAVITIPAGTVNNTIDALVVKGTSSIVIPGTPTPPLEYGTSGSLTTTVTAPVLAITKAVSPTGNQPPDTILTYTVTVTNNGLGVATSVIITDIIPQYTTYQAGTIMTGASTGTLASNTDAAGDGAQFDAGSNAIVAGGASKTLGVGGQFILEFQVKID